MKILIPSISVSNLVTAPQAVKIATKWFRNLSVLKHINAVYGTLKMRKRGIGLLPDQRYNEL